MVSISIIIPVYNMGFYLPLAIESIISLNRSDYEIVIVDDGSTDETPRIIQELAMKYGEVIRVIQQPNQGLAKARNKGIDAAKGKYIIPLDADNKLADGYFTKAIELLESDGSIHIVYGDYECFGDRNEYISQTHFSIIKLSLKNYIDACAIFRKEVWEAVGGYDGQMPAMGHEDWEFWIHAFLKGFRFQQINTCCFYYRVRKNSMLRTVTSKKLMENQLYIYEKHGRELFPQMRDNFALLLSENDHLKRRLSWYKKSRIKGALKLLFNK